MKAHELAKLLLTRPDADIVFHGAGESFTCPIEYCVHSSTTDELDLEDQNIFILASEPDELNLPDEYD